MYCSSHSSPVHEICIDCKFFESSNLNLSEISQLNENPNMNRMKTLKKSKQDVRVEDSFSSPDKENVHFNHQDLKEFSLFDDFSPSVKEMLNELGLKPPTTSRACGEMRKPFEDVQNIPRPLPLQENRILMNKLEKIGTVIPSILSSVNVGGRTKVESLGLTNEIVEELEKERLRRKHCECVVEDLQQKLLTREQELALVSSVNKKKAETIQEFQQTLENLAIAWQKLEGTQVKAQKELEIECNNLKRQLKENCEQKKLLQNELDVAKRNVSETTLKLTKDKEQYEKEINALKNTNENLRRKCEEQEEKLKIEYVFVEDLKKEIVKLQNSLKKEQYSHLQKSADFDCFQRNIELQLSKEKRKIEEYQTKLEEMAFNLETANADNFALKEQLELTTNEKNFAEEELRRREAEYVSQEVKWKAEIERKVNEVHFKAKEEEENLRETLDAKYKQEIDNLLMKHEEWNDEQEAQYLSEIQEIKDSFKAQFEEVQQWLNAAETEAVDLTRKIEKIESGRSQMISRLHSFLQYMWKNSFQLFYGTLDASPEVAVMENSFLNEREQFSIPQQYASEDWLDNLPTRQHSLPEMNRKFEPVDRQDFSVAPLSLKFLSNIELSPDKDIKVHRERKTLSNTISTTNTDSLSCPDKFCKKHLISTQQQTVDSSADSQSPPHSICPSKCSCKSSKNHTINCNDCRRYIALFHRIHPDYQQMSDISETNFPSKDESKPVKVCSSNEGKNNRFLIPCKDSDVLSDLYEGGDGKREGRKSYLRFGMTELPKFAKGNSLRTIHEERNQDSEEKYETHLQPLTKEIVNVSLAQTFKNYDTCDDNCKNSMSEQTAEIPTNMHRKRCTVNSSIREKISFLRKCYEPIKNIKPVYSNDKIKCKDVDGCNLQPWK